MERIRSLVSNFPRFGFTESRVQNFSEAGMGMSWSNPLRISSMCSPVSILHCSSEQKALVDKNATGKCQSRHNVASQEKLFEFSAIRSFLYPEQKMFLLQQREE